MKWRDSRYINYQKFGLLNFGHLNFRLYILDEEILISDNSGKNLGQNSRLKAHFGLNSIQTNRDFQQN